MSRTLINEAANAAVVKNLLTAETLPDRMRGLLGRASLPAGTGLLIRPCRSIHMWFMRFPIDAAFLDADMQVLRIVRGLRPWRVAWAPRKTACVLETAAGGLEQVHVGDRLIESCMN